MQKSESLQVSNNLFIIPDDEQFLLYEPIRKCVLEVNKALVDELNKYASGLTNEIQDSPSIVEELKEAGILTTGRSRYQEPRFVRSAEFDPTGITLFLTTRCSLRCIYCYSSGGDNNRTLPWEIAKAGIDWIIRHTKSKGRNRFRVSFHGGGEITTAFPQLKKYIAYIRSEAKRESLQVFIEAGLNGITSPDIVQWLVDNIDSATISLDGLPIVQNRQRPLIDGNPSYTKVEETLRYLDGKDFPYGIRSTITSEHVDLMADCAEFIGREFKTRSIQFEPVFIVGRAEESGLDSVDAAAFVEGFRKAAKILEQMGKTLKYSGARAHKLTNIFCEAVTGNSFCITPDGNLSSCYEVTDCEDHRASLLFFGQYNPHTGEFNFNHDKINQLRTLTVEHKDFCQDCFCKWHCAGDCPAKLALLNDAWNPSSNPRCTINRELTKDQLKSAFH